MNFQNDADLAHARKRLAIALAVFVVVLLAVGYSRRAPRPAAFGAPEGQFSAERARVILGRLAGDGLPHPVGSAQNDVVRDRLLRELEAVGLKPRLDIDFACSPYGSCATVQNIVATIHGTTRGPAIVLNAHYDSVPASPGAGDDLAACAAMVEVARAFRSGWPPQRDIVLLFDDGEEAGLLGAEAWVRRNDPKSVLAMVVLEARGSSGRAMMFETSQGNASVVDAYARAVDDPAATSLSFAIYQLLPNDTNFTVFKRAGIRGMAIAAIGDPAQYHTPANSVANVSAGTIQHYGDQALALARRLGGLDTAPAANSSYFDLLGSFVLRWPESWNLPLAVVASLLALAGLVASLRGRAASIRGTSIALGVAVGAIAAALLASWGLTRLATFRTLGAEWPASGVWLAAAGWALAVCAVAALTHLARRRITVADAWNAYALVWSLAAIALSLLLPGGSFCVVMPLLIASAVALAAGEAGRAAAPFVGLAAGGLMLFAVALELPIAMGASMLPVASALIALVVLAAGPILLAGDSASRTARLAAIVAFASCVGFVVTPVWTPRVPRHMSLVQVESVGQAGAKLVAVDARPERRAPPLPGSWTREAIGVSGGGLRLPSRPVWWTAVPPSGEPAPEAEIESWAPLPDGRVRATIRVRSARGARVLGLHLDRGVAPKVFRVADFTFDPPSQSGFVIVHSADRDGIAVDLEFKPLKGATITFQDETPDLPAEARAVADARSGAMSPVHRGDRLVVSRSVGLTPALR